MIEQQLQVSPSELQKESKIDWARVNKLYHLTAKIVRPPEPDRQWNDLETNNRYSIKDFEQILAEILQEIKTNNNQQIQLIEEKYNLEISQLKDRIFRLQNLIKESNTSQKANQMPSSAEQKRPYATPLSKSAKYIEQLPSTGLKQRHARSNIYIEQNQENQVSLLDEDQQENKYITPRTILDTANQVIPKQLSENYMREFEQESDQEETDYRHQQRRSMEVSCHFHEQEIQKLSKQITEMKQYMEKVYSIQIRDLPWVQKFKTSEKQSLASEPTKVLINVSTNAEKHLMNENAALRKVNEKYKNELKKTKRQAKNIRLLLNSSLKASSSPSGPQV